MKILETIKNDIDKLRILIEHFSTSKPEALSKLLNELIEEEAFDIFVKSGGWDYLNSAEKENLINRIELSDLYLNEKYFYFLSLESFDKVDASWKKPIKSCILQFIHDENYDSIISYCVYLVENQKIDTLLAIVRMVKLDEIVSYYPKELKKILKSLWEQERYDTLCVILERFRIGAGISKAIDSNVNDMVTELLTIDQPNSVDLAFYFLIDTESHSTKEAITLILSNTTDEIVKLKYNLKAYMEKMIGLDTLCEKLEEIPSIEGLIENYKVFSEMVYCGASVFLDEGIESYNIFRDALGENYLFDKKIGRFNTYTQYLDKERYDYSKFSSNQIRLEFKKIQEFVDFYFSSFLKYIVPIQRVAGYHCNGNYMSFKEYVERGDYSLVGSLKCIKKKDDYLTYVFSSWEVLCRQINIETKHEFETRNDNTFFIRPKMLYINYNPGRDVISYEELSLDNENWIDCKRKSTESLSENILKEILSGSVDGELRTNCETQSDGISIRNKIKLAISLLQVIAQRPTDFGELSEVVQRLTSMDLNHFKNPISCMIKIRESNFVKSSKYTELARGIIKAWMDYAKKGLTDLELQNITYIFFNTVICFLIPVHSLVTVFRRANIDIDKINELFCDKWIYGCCVSRQGEKLIVEKNLFGENKKTYRLKVDLPQEYIGMYVLYTIQSKISQDEKMIRNRVREVRICPKADKNERVEYALKAGNLGRALQLRKTDEEYFYDIDVVEFIHLWVKRHSADMSFNKKNSKQQIDESLMLKEKSKGEFVVEGFENCRLVELDNDNTKLTKPGQKVKIISLVKEGDTISVIACCE